MGKIIFIGPIGPGHKKFDDMGNLKTEVLVLFIMLVTILVGTEGYRILKMPELTEAQAFVKFFWNYVVALCLGFRIIYITHKEQQV
jgi:uncharacterized membrane protein